MSIILYEPNPWLEPKRQEELAYWFLVLIDGRLLDGPTLSSLLCVSKGINQLLSNYYCCRTITTYTVSRLLALSLEQEERWTYFIAFYPQEEVPFPQIIARDQSQLPLLEYGRSKSTSSFGIKYTQSLFIKLS